jgi:uncharacterized protein (TIGR00369 family)
VTVHKLRNAKWGFETNCFVCEPSNAAGLRIPFEHDDEADVVRGAFSLDERFSGAPTYVHGGLTLAILDEAAAWATIAISGKFAVTAETSARFLHPVRLGRNYRVEGRVEATTDARITVACVVLDEKDRPCAESTAEMAVLSVAQAVDALGTEPGEDEAPFLR